MHGGPQNARKAMIAGLALLTLAASLSPAGLSADDAATFATTQWAFPHSTPVKMVPLPQGGLLVAAQTGQIYHYTASGQSNFVTLVPAHPPNGEYGLLGMALHPDYPAEPYVYVFRTDTPTAPATQSILRFSWIEGGTASAPLEPIVTGLPANPVCCHNGGRIAFGPDGMLYATVGDNMVSLLAQNPFLEPGSVLRYTPDGDVPTDNPFYPSPVYVWGLRNTFGLTFDDEWGLIVTDNGPSGFDGPGGYDRLFIGLASGDNAGWPLTWGFLGTDTPPGFAEPTWNSGNQPSAPTGVLAVRDSAVTNWNDRVIWCNYNQNQARSIDPSNPNAISIVLSGVQCRFDVVQDAQGRIIFATSNTLLVVS